MGCLYLLLSIFELENACLMVYVGMVADYGQCLMVIEHIAWFYKKPPILHKMINSPPLITCSSVE